MGEFVNVERSDDGVAVIRLDRPKMNALCVALLDELLAAAQDLTANPAGAVVIWGGERIFAAGAEISEFGGPDEA
jgi:enoyl-CoA hydratase